MKKSEARDIIEAYVRSAYTHGSSLSDLRKELKIPIWQLSKWVEGLEPIRKANLSPLENALRLRLRALGEQLLRTSDWNAGSRMPNPIDTATQHLGISRSIIRKLQSGETEKLSLHEYDQLACRLEAVELLSICIPETDIDYELIDQALVAMRKPGPRT